MGGAVLFLDLATQMGWCEGVPGERPTSGTVRLAPEGSPSEAVHAGLLRFMAERLMSFRYRQIVYEAPLDPRFMGQKTNLNTALMLLGMPAIVGAMGYETGHYGRVKSADVGDVRKALLGKRPPRDQAKQYVMWAVRALGYDPADDNEADAIAGWHYACAILEPKTAITTTPLLAGSRK